MLEFEIAIAGLYLFIPSSISSVLVSYHNFVSITRYHRDMVINRQSRTLRSVGARQRETIHLLDRLISH